MKKIYSILLLAISFSSYSQNVGIGTSTPAQKLEVAGWIELGNESEGSSGTAGSIRYHTIGKIQFHNGTAWVDILSTNNNGDYIQNLTVNDNFGAGQSASYDITGNAEIGGGLEVSGNVGIGTTAPGARLDVQGASGIRIGNSTYDANLVFGNNASWKSGIRVYDNNEAEMRIWTNQPTGEIVLTNGYDGDQSTVLPTNGLWVKNNNVGIGNFSATAIGFKLHVPSGYIGTDYINTTDNSVGSGVTGVMIKAGDNFLRTGTANAVATFLDGATTGPWIPNNGIGDWQIASSSTSTGYSAASLELRESNFTGNGSATPPHLGFHWGGVVASNIAIENSGRIAITNNPGSSYENLVANDITANDLLSTTNYGRGLVGLYSSTRYQNVFAMGTAYRLAADGTSPGNMYGIAWTHSNVGGQSKSGLGHQMLIMDNGTTTAAIGSGIWTNYDITGNRLLDQNDPSYYVDPNGTSELNLITNRTRATMGNSGLYNTPRHQFTSDTRYWTGSMGWGNTDFNTIYSNWGSGFFDTWSSPGNAPGGSSHYVGLQGFHYNHGDGTNAYGFQMAMAGEANNRFFWRSGWPSPRPWVEMVHTGNATSLYPNINGDNLGNHSATTTLSMNGNLVSAAGKITFNGVGGNSGQGNDSYAIYQEAGAWSYPYPDLCIGYHTGIKLGAHYSYNGTRFYNNSDFATQIFSVGDGDNYTRVCSNGGSDGIAMGQIHGDNTNTIQTYIDGQWANRASYAGGCCNPLLLQPDVGTVGIGTTAPSEKLHVAGGNIRWSNSLLVADQGGSIELGGTNSIYTGGTPYIDFHCNSGYQRDYDVRLMASNDAYGPTVTMYSHYGATNYRYLDLDWIGAYDNWADVSAWRYWANDWDNLYDDVHNDLDLIDNIKPQRRIDPKSGNEVITNDPTTVPSFLTTKAIDNPNSYKYDINRVSWFSIGAIRQLRKETKTRDEDLENRVERLESLLADLTGEKLDKIPFVGKETIHQELSNYVIIDPRIRANDNVAVSFENSFVPSYKLKDIRDGSFEIVFEKPLEEGVNVSYTVQ